MDFGWLWRWLSAQSRFHQDEWVSVDWGTGKAGDDLLIFNKQQMIVLHLSLNLLLDIKKCINLKRKRVNLFLVDMPWSWPWPNWMWNPPVKICIFNSHSGLFRDFRSLNSPQGCLVAQVGPFAASVTVLNMKSCTHSLTHSGLCLNGGLVEEEVFFKIW